MTDRPLFPIYDILEAWAAFAYSTPEVKPQHHALYQSIIQQCKVRRGLARFQLSYQYGMQISGIGSKNTYLATLRELETWGFITYTPGANAYKTPIVEAHFRESIENLLVIYRTSYWESTEYSTDHNKEGIREKGEREKEKGKPCSNCPEHISAIAALKKELAEALEKIKNAKSAYRELRAENETLKSQLAKPPKAKRTAKSDELAGKGKIITDLYREWYLLNNRMEAPAQDAADNVAARNIFKNLMGQPEGGSEEKVANLFSALLQNWPKLEPFLQRQQKLSQISSNLTNIIPQLTNGKLAYSRTPGLVDPNRAANAAKYLVERGIL